MARIITIPEAFTLILTDSTGKSIGKPYPWDEFIDLMSSDQRFVQESPDVFQAIELRLLLKRTCAPGSEIEVTDAQWRLLDGICRKPLFHPVVVYQSETYLRAICDAPVKKAI
jgi:hypothetical protein